MPKIVKIRVTAQVRGWSPERDRRTFDVTVPDGVELSQVLEVVHLSTIRGVSAANQAARAQAEADVD